MAAPQRRRDLGLDLGELRQQGRGLAFEFSVDLAGGGRWIRTIGSPPEIVVDPNGSRRDHRAKYGCLSARPRVRCLCPPGKTQHLLPKSVFDRPGSDRWNLASTTFPDAGPMVRIRFPPPGSHEQIEPSGELTTGGKQTYSDGEGLTVRIPFPPARSPLRNLRPTISAQPAEVADPPPKTLSPLQQCAHVRDRVGIAFQAVRILFGFQFNLQPDAVRIAEVEGPSIGSCG